MNIRMPQEGDKLFVDGEPSHALLPAWDGEISFAAVGFKTAADDMVEALCQGHTNNSWIFPVVYCYRHYLELMLKSIIELYYACQGTGETFPRSHNLKELWSIVKEHCYDSDTTEEEQAEIDIVEALMIEFHDFDIKSTAFRYAERVPLSQIDLRNLADVMEGLENHLAGLWSMWDDLYGNIH